jgi:tRNA A-37 threonylcarbamoyl transferase component Bud32
MQGVVGAGAGRLVAGRYRLSRPIGRGAMGIVWRGRDELLDRDVAVKEVQITSLAMPADAEIIYQRTLREARTAARLSHPGVVTVFDVVEENSSPWIVMELVQARSLDQVIAEDGPLPPLEAAQIGEGLLSALATAHASGVLHRDVKPSNVLITDDGRAVLTDFGIATFEGDPGLTQVGMVVGTPGFTAPERVRGKPASPASDLWSLGATLYAAVEGRGPFDRPGGSLVIMDGVVSEDAPRAPSAGPLAPVIEALLRGNPAARPDSETAATLMADAASQAKAGPGPLGGSWPDLPAGQARFAVAGDARADSRAVAGDAGAVEADAGDAGPAAEGSPAASTARGGAATGDAAVPGAAPGRTAAVATTPFSATAGRTTAGRDTAGSTTAFGVAPADDAGVGGRTRGDDAAAVAQDAAIPAFMEAPAFADLKMPDLDASADLADQAGLALPADLPAFMDARRHADLQAPPPENAVPWDLAGASANWARRDPLSLADSPGADSPGQAKTTPAGSPATRPGTRRRVLAAAMAAAVLAVAGVAGWSAYSRSRTAATGQPRPTAQSPAGATVPTVPARPARHNSSGQHHAGHKTTGPGAAAGATATSKTHPAGGSTLSHKLSSPAKPSATPNPSATGSPGSGGGTPPPAGYQWFQVSAASLGTTAGFKIAVPDTWRMSRNGLVTYLDVAAGKPYIEVDVTPFAYSGPVREAYYRQAQARASHLYPLYRLIGIRSAGFRAVPEAIWGFHWQEPGVGQVGVLEVLFTLTTSAGQQSYALSVSASAARFVALRVIFHQALQTFAPLP